MSSTGSDTAISKNQDDRVTKPKVANLQAGFGVGGRGKSVLEEIDESLQEDGWGKLMPAPDDSGIVRVTDLDEGATEVKEYTLIPDSDNVEWTGEEGPGDLYVNDHGFYEVKTSAGLKIPFKPVPKDLDSIPNLLGGGRVALGGEGDVRMQSSEQQNTTGDMTVGMFDSAVAPAPEGLAPGFHEMGNGGWMVYEDGTGQKIRPTFPEPNSFVSEGIAFEGIESVEQNADGTFSIVFEGQSYTVKPRFGTRTRELGGEESTEPNITVNEDGSITFSVVLEEDEIEDVAISDDGERKLRGRSRKKTETDGDVDDD
jgi:hypothetical protein